MGAEASIREWLQLPDLSPVSHPNLDFHVPPWMCMPKCCGNELVVACFVAAIAAVAVLFHQRTPIETEWKKGHQLPKTNFASRCCCAPAMAVKCGFKGTPAPQTNFPSWGCCASAMTVKCGETKTLVT